MFGFGKKSQPAAPKTLTEMSNDELREFQKSMRAEIRASDREISKQLFTLERHVKESERDLQKKIKEGADRSTLRIFAKNLLLAKKGRDKNHVCKTQLQSVEMSVNHMIASVKMTKTVKEATGVMAKVNSLVKIPELTAAAAGLQMQLEKVGIVGEMVDEAMEDLNENVGEDEDVDAFLDSLTSPEQSKKPNTQKTQNDQQEDNIDEILKQISK